MAPNTLDSSAVAAAQTDENMRRCFICLTDEEPSDPPSSWVDPCPCTLEAHQDCMLSWVTDCERSNKPLQCPVCKSQIRLEGPWDPIVALTDVVSSKFTRASPFMLLTSVTMGVQFSLQMYGACAMWAFAGRESLVQFMLGPELKVGGQNSRIMRMASERLGNALILMNVGPALLVGQLTPWLGNKIFLPAASLYGVYRVMHDEQFLAWPPSPQMAMTLFPYARSAYLNFWREFVFPYEVNLNRQMQGLPALEPRQNEEPVINQRAVQRNENGGVLGFLNNLLDALEPEDDDEGRDNAAAPLRIDHQEVENEDGDIIVDIVLDGVIEIAEEDVNEFSDDEQDGIGNGRNGPVARHAARVVPEVEAEPAAALADPPAQHDEHEAPQAPPARRPGLGSILSGVSNAIVSALILPGISYVMGELLRLALPKTWTTMPRNPWFRTVGIIRPGLFQQQWGRSLVGGCLWVVMKDVVRLYTKYRKVAAMGKRRVQNVERHRRGKYRRSTVPHIWDDSAPRGIFQPKADRPTRRGEPTPSGPVLAAAHRGALVLQSPELAILHPPPSSIVYRPPSASLRTQLQVLPAMASAQTSKQRLALAICDFLATSSTDGTLTADDKDSIDVAINCIAESTPSTRSSSRPTRPPPLTSPPPPMLPTG
ncbi:hypothetical protein G7Z17_g13424 [Cylindrodendrum hubeiense]|uniref:RING-CH-type domain-containing protein n=1 Tax=Cylindrodendrum hubeiense TaxID=595255 RepID=A0A9P5GTM1_9HYPO|nr:hypothetical protein G7Z17_g13424 [Cylindrodendrum hubeiense]